MRRSRSPHRSITRHRLMPMLAAGALVLAACGGDDGDDSGAGGSGTTATEAATPDGGDAGGGATDGPVALTGVQVDLVGPDVMPAAEIATNLLPSVVLDDISTGRKVNFRNLVPQDKPILLWMYAPH